VKRPLVFGVADLLRRPGNRRDEVAEAVLDGLEVTSSRVIEGAPVDLHLHLESVNEGIVVKGVLHVPWEGECRRCLCSVRSALDVQVFEVFEDNPVEGETSKLDIDRIDLEPLVRETVLLELPIAPLCREDCAGLCPECGADRNEGDCGHGLERRDLRWSALDELRFDD
jgi:uncharacterized protein